MTLTIEIKTNMIAKGISHDDFPENGVGRWSYNYMSEGPMYCFWKVLQHIRLEGQSHIFTEAR